MDGVEAVGGEGVELEVVEGADVEGGNEVNEEGWTDFVGPDSTKGTFLSKHWLRTAFWRGLRLAFMFLASVSQALEVSVEGSFIA